MTTLIHHSPLGALQIAGVAGSVEPGEPFDIDDAAATVLLEQSDLYELAPDEPTGWAALTVAELKDSLRARELKTTGKHADLVARLEAAEPFDELAQQVAEEVDTDHAHLAAAEAGDTTATQGETE